MQVESAAIVIGAVCLNALVASQSTGQTYGIDFVAVGAAGNRATTAAEAFEWTYRGGAGAVNHGFKISRTELTVSQYLEFVQAYSPYYRGHPNASELTGFWISTGDGHTYNAYPGSERFAADMTWQMAARYCNWLTNGKAPNQAAFESGAYDTSTFTRNADFSWNDQATHSPGAMFWIPTLDEWIKAVYYDPNRYGQDQGGYWYQPNGTNIALIPGLPQNGGETSAGIEDFLPVPVGSYPSVQSPWGLLDASGGLAEYTSEWTADHTSRMTKGTWQGSLSYEYGDSINGWLATAPNEDSLFGLRIATIPSAGSGVTLALCSLLAFRRRR